jgi:hypothetical protein
VNLLHIFLVKFKFLKLTLSQLMALSKVYPYCKICTTELLWASKFRLKMFIFNLHVLLKFNTDTSHQTHSSEKILHQKNTNCFLRSYTTFNHTGSANLIFNFFTKETIVGHLLCHTLYKCSIKLLQPGNVYTCNSVIIKYAKVTQFNSSWT